MYKSGDKHTFANFRPISKLNTIKLFKKICDNIFPVLRPIIIINEQQGFVNKRSTETKLYDMMMILHFVVSPLDSDYQ